MRKLREGNENAVNKKIELMIKVITRTDSYLNSANTKSTILLSLSSALIVALTINFEKIVSMIPMDSDKVLLSILLSFILFLLITSMIFSLRGITPIVRKSEINNTFSFVDIARGYDGLASYNKQFSTVSDKVFLNELTALNHNLSKILILKYEKQITAITCVEAAAYVLCFSIFVIILANC